MEKPHDNPNEALVPIFVGNELVYIPVIEYYIYNDNPKALLARLAIINTPESKND